ncbi:alcohol dehydrogenase catalytic domain-containing protein [Kitasatospora sp. NPDC001664]
MRAVTVSTFGGPENVEITEAPLPGPAVGELRVRTRAAAVHPADAAVRSGAVAAYLPPLPSHRLGWDLAGTVDAVGEGVTGFRPGDEVIGLSHWFRSHNGVHAEYAVLPASAVAPAPAGVDAAVAAALPLNGLTAAQALDATGLTAGRTLLITGAAGNLGGLALQLATARGLDVLALAGPGDRAFVTAHGARFVDRDDLASLALLAPDGVDAVLDTALLGPALLPHLLPGTVFVAVRPTNDLPADTLLTVVDVVPDGARLAELAALVAAGALTVRVDTAVPFTEAAKAHARLAERGVRGAVVLTF